MPFGKLSRTATQYFFITLNIIIIIISTVPHKKKSNIAIDWEHQQTGPSPPAPLLYTSHFASPGGIHPPNLFQSALHVVAVKPIQQRAPDDLDWHGMGRPLRRAQDPVAAQQPRRHEMGLGRLPDLLQA